MGKVLNKRSSALVNGEAKLPTASQIDYGEIAINFAKGKETISIKNSDDEIVTFSSDNHIENIIEENEYVVSQALNDINDRIPENTSDLTNDSGFITGYTETDPTVPSWAKQSTKPTYTANEVGAVSTAATYFDDAEYDSNTKRINFKKNNTVVDYIDATDFIKDGMVSSVTVSNGNLVMSFNTEAGREDIELSLSQIFNPSNYYNKTESDGLFIPLSGGTTAMNSIITMPSSYGRFAEFGEHGVHVEGQGDLCEGNFGDRYVTLFDYAVEGKAAQLYPDELILSPTSDDGDNNIGTHYKHNLIYKDSGNTGYTLTLPDKSGVIAVLSDIPSGFTETDPTVPSWAKQSTKPTYTASEVGALPTGTTLDNVPDGTTRKLSNYATQANFTAHTGNSAIHITSGDVETQITSHNYITGYTETDPTVPSWAKQSTKPTYTASEVGALATGTTLDNVPDGTTRKLSDYATQANFSAHTGNTAIHLPSITASDEGKILQIVNGQWSLVTPTVIYTGNSAPDNVLGNNGDIYIQTS